MDFLHSIISDPAVGSALQGLIVALALAIIAALSNVTHGWIAANMNARQLALLRTAAESAATMVEQVAVDLQPEQKKALAVQTVQKYLDSIGLKMDAAAIDAAIETAVFDRFSWNHRLTAKEPAETEAPAEVATDGTQG